MHIEKSNDFEYIVNETDGTCGIVCCLKPRKTIVFPTKINGYTVKSLEYNCCAYTTGVEAAVIPDTVEEIIAKAFYACENLKTIRIGKNVKKIENEAFAELKNLEKVYFENDGLVFINRNAFAESKKATFISNSYYVEQFANVIGYRFIKKED